MPTYNEAVAAMRQGDAGYLSMLVMIAYAALASYYLAGKYQRIGKMLGMGALAAVPLATMLTNPVLGALAGLAVLVGIKFTFPRQINPIWPILALALVLRLPIMFDSLWYDEAFTARLASLPISNFWPALLSDVHPPLYYLLIMPLAQITDNAFLLRLPSLVMGLYSLYLIRQVALSLGFSQTTADLSALLLAVLPASIYYSTELRSYELLVVCVLWLVRAIAEDKPVRFAVWLGVLLWTHNVGLIYAGVIGVCALTYHPSRRWLKALVAGGAVGLLWFPLFLAQSANVGDGHWAYISPGAVFWPLLNMTVGVIGQEFIAPVVVTVLVMVFMSLAALLHSRWLMTKNGMLWLAVVFGVPALEALVSFAWKPIYVYRHFLPCMLLMVIAWAAMMERNRLARACLFPVLLLALFQFYSYGLPFSRPDFRAWLTESCAGADYAYATSINAAFILTENTDLPVYTWPGAVDNGQTVEPRNLLYFGLGSTPLPSGRVCILQIDIPATQQAERDYVASVLGQHEHKTTPKELGVWQVYYVHMVDSSAE